MGKQAINLEELSVEERLELIDQIWESLREEPSSVPVTEAQRAELDRRLDDLETDIEAGAALGIPWEEVLAQIRARSS